MVSQLDEHRHDISQVVIVDVGIINNVLSVINIMSNVELDYRYGVSTMKTYRGSVIFRKIRKPGKKSLSN